MTKQITLSKAGNAKNLFSLLKQPAQEEIDLRECKRARLGELVETVCEDEDPESYIEVEYHHKREPVFCWRFLRAVSYTDQAMVNVKTFEGDILQVAQTVHEQAKRREIVEKVDEVDLNENE